MWAQRGKRRPLDVVMTDRGRGAQACDHCPASGSTQVLVRHEGRACKDSLQRKPWKIPRQRSSHGRAGSLNEKEPRPTSRGLLCRGSLVGCRIDKEKVGPV